MGKLVGHLLLISALLFVCLEAKAQQTIINVPSSDILAPGDVMLKQSSRFRPFGDDKFVTLTPSVTVGSGFGTELSGGVATSIDDDTVVRGDFAAKKVFFIKSSNRFTVGLRVNPYLADSVAPDNFTYAHMTTRIRKTQTSLTAGMFVAGKKQFLPDQPGVLLGVDQVILPNKLRFAMDWISRNESYGLLGVGLKYRPVPTVSITSGVVIPNGKRGKLAFTVSVSKYLSFRR